MDSRRDGGTALGWQGSDFHCVTAVSIRLGQFAHVAPDDTEVGEVLLHPANLGTINYVRLTFLLHHLLQRCGVTGSAAFADDDFAHRVSNGLDELRCGVLKRTG